MFKINTDLSIEITRGDAVEFTVTAQDNGKTYVFQVGDIVRFRVFEKKGCECVVLQKDFAVDTAKEEVSIQLTEADTKIGDLINKPKDYWYEVELNPDTYPQTIIGYNEDGAKVFKLYPEGRDLGSDPIKPEDIPFVDKELDMTSHNPVENQAIVKEFNKVLYRSGGTMNGVIAMGGNKITGLGTPTNDTDAANKKFVTDAITEAALEGKDIDLSGYLQKSGGTMTGVLAMGGNKITNLANPTANTDAVPLGYANDNYAQAIKSADYPGCYYRTVNGLTEWINPPYVESTEYRTTERYMGQPVYTMLISESSWKSGNNIEVSFPNNKVYVTEISARVGSWALPFIDSTFTANGSAWVNVYTEVGKMVIQQRGGIGVSGALTIKVKYYYYA
jgi:hypothetical protein